MLIMLVGVAPAYAQIAVPEYMFEGTEIADFQVKPSYTAFEFSFDAPNRMDLYISQRKNELALAEQKDYASETPDGIYSYPVGTSVSAIFVGDVAYRNSMVKQFLDGNYIEAIAVYEKYRNGIADSEYYDESTVLYGVSLFEMANHAEGMKVLTEIANKDGSEYQELAQDKLFSMALSLGDDAIFDEFATTLSELSPYVVSIWLDYLYDNERYSDILNVLNASSIEQTYKEYTQLRVIATYFLKQYSEVLPYADAVKGSDAYAFVIDSYIITGDLATAEASFKELNDSPEWDTLKAKLDIALGNYEQAMTAVENIGGDNEKLDVFFYTISNKFAEVPAELIGKFTFSSSLLNDYVAFYKGLKLLSVDEYAKASESLALVAFNKELIVDSYFYLGMASIYTDKSRAEWNFNRYISNGHDVEKMMLSKFMLSQLYFLRSQHADALMLVGDCSENYCSRLKGDIYLSLGEYDKSIDIIDGLEDDRSHLIRGTAYYNLKMYNDALNEALQIKQNDVDSERLLMMTYYKLGRLDDADKVFKANMSDVAVFTNGIELMMLAGEHEKALEYLMLADQIPASMMLAKARLLANAGKDAEAEEMFERLLADGEYLYDSMTGLYTIAEKHDELKSFLAIYVDILNSYEDFEGKDALLAQFAAHAERVGEINPSIGYVNAFLEDYMSSPYLSDVYKTRARLYMATGRLDNCINDTDRVIQLGGEQAMDALFLKAECMEGIDMGKAVALYRSMATDENRFFQPANTRLTLLSTNPTEVLEASLKLQNISDEVYTSGVIRFVEMSNKDDYALNSEVLEELADTANGEVRSAIYWRMGQNYIEGNNYEMAVQMFMKGYYLLPKEAYAIKNLEGAKATYDARDMKSEAQIVSKLVEDNKK